MSITTIKGINTTAGEALSAFRLVKQDGTYCDAGQTWLGSTELAYASGANIFLILPTDGGQIKLEASAAIASGRVVYAAADGKISATPIGRGLGFASSAATAAGDLVTVVCANIPYAFEGKVFEAVADNKTLDIEDVGKVLYVTVDAKTITLPSVAVGLTYTIMNGSAALGAVVVNVSPAAADKIMGADLAGVDNKDRINTKATAVPGDYITIIYGSADGWSVVAEKGTWAAEG
jgi:hypothetical protein